MHLGVLITKVTSEHRWVKLPLDKIRRYPDEEITQPTQHSVVREKQGPRPCECQQEHCDQWCWGFWETLPGTVCEGTGVMVTALEKQHKIF